MKVELNSEKRDPTPELVFPAVYRERGYLLLGFGRHGGGVSFVRVQEGSYERMEEREFAAQFSPTDPEKFSFSYLALNMLGRATEGYHLSVRVRRRLMAMVTKEELMKLSERALAREYSRIMGLTRPLSRISINPEVRGRYIDDLLQQLEATPERAHAPTDTPTSSDAPDEGTDSPNSTTTEAHSAAAALGDDTAAAQGEHGMGSKKAAAKKVTKAPKAPKAEKAPKAVPAATRSVSYDKVAASVKNPYREGTMKAKAFDIFRDGGERAEILAKVLKLGVTESTAASWVNLFRKVK